jgi:hypothetical protein
MATRGLKKAGFQQGLFQTSATAKERVGTMRVTQDGRKFRYCKNGSVALVVAHLCEAVAEDADWVNEPCASTHAIGDVVFTETIVSTTVAENYFTGGMLYINDGTGQGHQYLIESSSPVAAGTSITLTLNDPLRVALVVTTSEFTIGHSPWMAVIAQATVTNPIIGIPPMAVPANHYCWMQTRGEAICQAQSTDGIGSLMSPGTTDGNMIITTTALDADLQIIGHTFGAATVATEYQAVFLTID